MLKAHAKKIYSKQGEKSRFDNKIS